MRVFHFDLRVVVAGAVQRWVGVDDDAGRRRSAVVVVKVGAVVAKHDGGAGENNIGVPIGSHVPELGHLVGAPILIGHEKQAVYLEVVFAVDLARYLAFAEVHETVPFAGLRRRRKRVIGDVEGWYAVEVQPSFQRVVHAAL